MKFEGESDLSKYNFLNPEEKVLVIKALRLMETARAKMKKAGAEVSLPYKMQLRSDCGEITRLVKRYRPDRSNEKVSQKLEHLLVKIQTEMTLIFGGSEDPFDDPFGE